MKKRHRGSRDMLYFAIGQLDIDRTLTASELILKMVEYGVEYGWLNEDNAPPAIKALDIELPAEGEVLEHDYGPTWVNVGDQMHTQRCVERFGNYHLRVSAYDRQYPDYCPDCNGSGVVCWEENQSPLGSGRRWMETICEPCEACWGRCPRCGVEINETVLNDFHDGAMECPHCGFKVGITPARPQEPECTCFWAAEKYRAKHGQYPEGAM